MTDPHSAPLSILHVTETLRGGLNTYLEEVVAYQIQDSSCGRIGVVAPGGDLVRSQLGDSETYAFARCGRGAISSLLFAIRILSAVFSMRPDVVHLHSSFAGFFGRILLAPWYALKRFEVVYTAHGWSFLAAHTRFEKRVFIFIERILSRFCTMIVCVSEAERRLAVEVGIDRDKTRVIHNPRRPLQTLTEIHAPVPDDRIRLLFVGRLDRAKGFDLLIDALSRVERTDWTIRVVGEAVHDSMPSVPERMRERVQMCGWLSGTSLVEEYLRANCVVVPSRWEAFGLVALEAMQLGRAVYATDVGGLPEIVDDGITGCLVAADPETLAAAINGIDIDRLAGMGSLGKGRAMELFSAAKSNAQLVQVYRCISGKGEE